MSKSKKEQSAYWFKVGEHGIMAFVMADSLDEAKMKLLEARRLGNPNIRFTLNDIDKMYKFAYKN